MLRHELVVATPGTPAAELDLAAASKKIDNLLSATDSEYNL
jgi:hypothetical protein